MSIPSLEQPTSETEDSSRWHGRLQLGFTADQRGTRLAQSQFCAPLRVQRAFYPEGPTVCHSVILHTAGGMVGGDRLSLSCSLQPQARALVTTSAASKIYRSQGLLTHQTTHLHLGAGSCLEWLPQETIVFQGAHYRQDLHIELEPGAIWLAWELTRFGRSARGEKFLQGHWRSHTEVWRQGQPLWIDRQTLPGGSTLLQSPNGLAGEPVLGSFVLIGQRMDADQIAHLRHLSSQIPWQGSLGITRLMDGLLCRYRGRSTVAARQGFITLWAGLRPGYLGRSVCLPRVWPA